MRILKSACLEFCLLLLLSRNIEPERLRSLKPSTVEDGKKQGAKNRRIGKIFSWMSQILSSNQLPERWKQGSDTPGKRLQNFDLEKKTDTIAETCTSTFLDTSFQVSVQILTSWQMPTYHLNLSANVTFSVRLSPTFYMELIASFLFFWHALFIPALRRHSTLTFTVH